MSKKVSKQPQDLMFEIKFWLSVCKMVLKLRSRWWSKGIDQTHRSSASTWTVCNVILCCWTVQTSLSVSYRKTSLHSCVPPSLTSFPSMPPTASPTLRGHCTSTKASFVWSRPPSWRTDGGTGLPFSQGHFLTALCSSPALNIPAVKLFSFTSPRVAVSRPFGSEPLL